MQAEDISVACTGLFAAQGCSYNELRQDKELRPGGELRQDKELRPGGELRQARNRAQARNCARQGIAPGQGIAPRRESRPG
ncbi:hypothetical protein PPUJ20066_32430 [Pseudomonas putida]|nr:hypothetical protein PPUJ20066_32430 [Pseudomonas putida]